MPGSSKRMQCMSLLSHSCVPASVCWINCTCAGHHCLCHICLCHARVARRAHGLLAPSLSLLPVGFTTSIDFKPDAPTAHVRPSKSCAPAQGMATIVSLVRATHAAACRAHGLTLAAAR